MGTLHCADNLKTARHHSNKQ